jgi:hypothetical protein
MKKNNIILTMIGMLVLSASLISVLENDIYRDVEWIKAQWYGQDIVTLIGVIPLYVLSLWFGLKKGSIKWRIAMIGFLTYFVYTYAFFVFVAKFTPLYFLHLPAFSLSIYALVFTLKPFLSGKSTFANYNKYVGSGVSAYILFMAFILTVLWFRDMFSFLLVEDYKSQTPDGEPPIIIYTLDLGFVIPVMVAGIIQFWRKKSTGYLITGIMLTKMTTLGFALMGMSLGMYYRNIMIESFLVFLWFILGIAGVVFTVLYFAYLRINVVPGKAA